MAIPHWMPCRSNGSPARVSTPSTPSARLGDPVRVLSQHLPELDRVGITSSRQRRGTTFWHGDYRIHLAARRGPDWLLTASVSIRLRPRLASLWAGLRRFSEMGKRRDIINSRRSPRSRRCEGAQGCTAWNTTEPTQMQDDAVLLVFQSALFICG